MKELRWPQFLGAPFQIIWFESDQIGIFFVFLFLSQALVWWFFPLPFLAVYFYSKAKKRYPRGFLRHLLYFIGLIRFKGYPDYTQKEFSE
jgi:hypothetical protein